MDFLLITKRYLIAINFCQKLFLQMTVEQSRRTSEGWRLGWLVVGCKGILNEIKTGFLYWNDYFLIKSDSKFETCFMDFQSSEKFYLRNCIWKKLYLKKTLCFCMILFTCLPEGWGSWNGIWSLNWLLNQLNILLTLGLIIIIIFDLLKCPCVSYK